MSEEKKVAAYATFQGDVQFTPHGLNVSSISVGLNGPKDGVAAILANAAAGSRDTFELFKCALAYLKTADPTKYKLLLESADETAAALIATKKEKTDGN